MDNFSKMVEGVKITIEKMKKTPAELPWYMSVEQLEMTLKENKKPVIKASICNGEQVAGFKNIHTGKIEEVMLIKNQADLDAFKKMYGIDGEIEKEY